VNPGPRDDACGMAPGASVAMRIGDLVLHDGRLYVLRGVEPMSVDERKAELEDPESGERLRVPLDEIEEPGGLS
jgi:hypothetical protein